MTVREATSEELVGLNGRRGPKLAPETAAVLELLAKGKSAFLECAPAQRRRWYKTVHDAGMRHGLRIEVTSNPTGVAFRVKP